MAFKEWAYEAVLPPLSVIALTVGIFCMVAWTGFLIANGIIDQEHRARLAEHAAGIPMCSPYAPPKK